MRGDLEQLVIEINPFLIVALLGTWWSVIAMFALILFVFGIIGGGGS